MKKPFILTIAGKGGVGKTSFTVLFFKALSELEKYKILLIDADPTHSHLCDMMNIHPKKSIEAVRKNLIQQVSEKNKNVSDIAQNIDFKVYDAMTETKYFCLLSLGQPEGPGCFCPSNLLLRNVIENISRDFDVIIIDAEAGLEQIHRQVFKAINYLIILSDLSLRSIETAHSIKKSAMKFSGCQDFGIVINRATGNIDPLIKRIKELEISILGLISEDPNIHEYDLQGKPLINLPNDTKSYLEVKEIVNSIFGNDLDLDSS